MGEQATLEEVRRLRWERRALADQYQQLRELLEAFLKRYGDRPCRFDHDGYCQEHESKPCLVTEVAAVLG